MFFTKYFGLAAIAATLSSALPALIPRQDPAPSGGVQIVNNLNIPIYAWSVSDSDGPMQTLPPSGGSYSEPWRSNPNGGGISIKLATDPSEADVLQFEYTDSNPTVYWDLSCINMGLNSQFASYGFSVTSNNDQCPPATCTAGDTACSAAYLQPSDNGATHGCPVNTGFTVQIGQ